MEESAHGRYAVQKYSLFVVSLTAHIVKQTIENTRG